MRRSHDSQAGIIRLRSATTLRHGTADFLPQFAHKPALAAPDSRARYCNVSYVLAGLALERTIGESYRSLVTRKVLERAGMTGAGFLDRRDAVPRGRGLGPGRGDLAVEHLAIRRSVRRTAELMHG